MMTLNSLLNVWGEAAWRASWQAGLAALIVWGVCRIAPKIPARVHSWLWRLVVLKFLVALLWSAPIELPVLPAAAATTQMAIELPSAVPLGAATAVHESSSGGASPWLIPFVIWTFVVVWQLVRVLSTCRNAYRLRKSCIPSKNGQLIDQLAKLSTLIGLRTPPALLEMQGQGSPLVVGMLRPAIVMPATTVSRLDMSERTLVIAHELAHIRRHDLVWGFAGSIMRVLFFFHPLAWLSERQLQLSQEIAADELAIALQRHDPVCYARLLVSIVSKFGPRRLIPTLSVGTDGPYQSLKRRLSAMRFMRQIPLRIVVAYAVVLGAVALVGLVPWRLVAAENPPDRAPDERTVNGQFVSYSEGVLKIKTKEEKSEVAKESTLNIGAETKVVSHIKGAAQEGTARDAFKRWESGAPISIEMKGGKAISVEVGTNKTADKVPDRGPDRVPDREKDVKRESRKESSIDSGKQSDRVPEKVAGKPVHKGKNSWGKLVSFKDSILTIRLNSDALVETKIPENVNTLVWSNEQNAYKPVSSADALSQAKPGTWTVVNVSNENVTVRLGARKGSSAGTFVSFKDDRLLMLGKDLANSFTKKYGNNIHMNKLRDDVMAYESIDGGDYQLLGSANKVLGSLKEGTLVTVHGEGDDNITMIQIGMPKQN